MTDETNLTELPIDSSLDTQDNTVIDPGSGKILYFGVPRFIRDIGEGDCCFVCGASPSSTVFNDEHILPDWILRRYNLHSLRITLPNRQYLTYGGYKIPCCEACNASMSNEFEVPMSVIFAQGYHALVKHIERDGPLKLFQWLNLIFLKTHLKDKFLRFHLDSRQGQEKIASSTHGRICITSTASAAPFFRERKLT